MTKLTKKGIQGICNCCGRLKKIVNMYVLQDGSTAWICRPCRKGRAVREMKGDEE